MEGIYDLHRPHREHFPRGGVGWEGELFYGVLREGEMSAERRYIPRER
jgi:hypothetical protein